ncbi:MAG: sigma-54 dependent transcriptional regulator, partial [Planctomycetia bacterium]|nr:sigma-54 dependent transcriptional regulator [Planctomycetia bacterium]
AVKNGAFDYLVKPFDLDQVQAVLARALLKIPDRPADSDAQVCVGELIGSSTAMQEVFKRIALAASSEASVLLSGESGTGKELAARAIHRFGNRADRPFVAVNVASLSPSLVESELFGHVRGSFTGADEARTGLLAQANGGTLFLDEVADVPLPVQVKLLRALELGEVVPVGANEPVRSDFRLISASHQDLLEKVDRGEFRHDLYFRLCAFRIEMPPLRDRPDDVVTLAEHFLATLPAGGTAGRPRMTPAFRKEIQGRQWSGNVRELRNAIEHAVVLARGGLLLPEHLPSPVSPPRATKHQSGPEQITSLIGHWAATRLTEGASESELYSEFLQLVEPPLLRRVLQHSRGQYLAAARRLGLHRTTLKKKLDQYGIDDGGEER